MNYFHLLKEQKDIIERPVNSKIFLEGPAGTGKSTVGVNRILYLEKNGVWPNNIIVIVPQRTLAGDYREKLKELSGGHVTITTLSGLAKKMITLFWPLISEKAGFKNPSKYPVFLSLETAQYYMSLIVKPLLKKGFFHSLTIKRSRIYSQILDNLNKSAVVRFHHSKIGERLKSGLMGDPGQSRVYDEAGTCAGLFREYCLEYNLLDFSLVIELLADYLWPLPLCREYLLKNYEHIIFDNIEEAVPVTHDILREWLPSMKSALFIYDTDGGYRTFLGADPAEGLKLKECFSEKKYFTESFHCSENIKAFEGGITRVMKYRGKKPGGDLRQAISYRAGLRYHTQMLDNVSENISGLIHKENISPEEIVIVAPYLSDSLCFSLTDRLRKEDVPVRTYRPSRPLRDEPVIRCLLTFASLAHPSWNIIPSKFEVTSALMEYIDDLDLTRADLISTNLYSFKDVKLGAFSSLSSELQERVTFEIGKKYKILQEWLSGYINVPQERLDHFLSRLFGEVLSQKGYNNKFETGQMIAKLLSSIKKFYNTTGEDKSFGKEYIELIFDGLAADQYIADRNYGEEKAVLISPSHTYLLSNRPVDYQFWINPGGTGWWERLYQPLTHAHIMSRQWKGNEPWSDINEFQVRQEALYRLLMGLLRRCRKKVYLAISELSEYGYEQQGKLLKIIQQVLRNC